MNTWDYIYIYICILHAKQFFQDTCCRYIFFSFSRINWAHRITSENHEREKTKRKRKKKKIKRMKRKFRQRKWKENQMQIEITKCHENWYDKYISSEGTIAHQIIPAKQKKKIKSWQMQIRIRDKQFWEPEKKENKIELCMCCSCFM